MTKDIILYEDKSVYDGWICWWDPDTNQITWRDSWPINTFNSEKKKDLENSFRDAIKDMGVNNA